MSSKLTEWEEANADAIFARFEELAGKSYDRIQSISDLPQGFTMAMYERQEAIYMVQWNMYKEKIYLSLLHEQMSSYVMPERTPSMGRNRIPVTNSDRVEWLSQITLFAVDDTQAYWKGFNELQRRV